MATNLSGITQTAKVILNTVPDFRPYLVARATPTKNNYWLKGLTEPQVIFLQKVCKHYVNKNNTISVHRAKCLLTKWRNKAQNYTHVCHYVGSTGIAGSFTYKNSVNTKTKKMMDKIYTVLSTVNYKRYTNILFMGV